MTDEEQNKKDLDKLQPQAQTLELNGHEITFPPLENDATLQATVESEKRGGSDLDFFLELIAISINTNDGFEDVTKEDVKDMKGTILPMLQAVQSANGLDFSEEDVEGLAAQM